MAKRQRIQAKELARTLDAAAGPVYVLDAQRTLVFCNAACRAWIGPESEQLLGCRCDYHDSPEVTGPEAIAAALCPPPAALQGRETAANVCRVDAAGRSVFRAARFIPLGHSADDLLAVVAILGTEDLPEPPEPPPARAEPDAIELRELLQRYRHEASARCRIERLVGQSPAMRLARQQVELAVGSRASVLLVGPPGSGRQQTASAIHYANDPVGVGPLVPLACSLLGPDVMRSTLDALRRLPPQLVGGTLLLSQADQLLPEIQGDLAEVLADKAFSMRLMATAEQPLRDLARRGRYREDLASLLSTIVVELPALVSRREDLPLLAQLFLEEINARGGKQLGGFTPDALDRLDGYTWPGNIDELLQVVAQCHERAAGPLVRSEDLPERLRWTTEPSAKARRKDETIVLDEYLGRIERELVRRALARAKGNKAKAARLLGLTRPRLYRRMVQLGLEENGGRGPT